MIYLLTGLLQTKVLHLHTIDKPSNHVLGSAGITSVQKIVTVKDVIDLISKMDPDKDKLLIQPSLADMFSDDVKIHCEIPEKDNGFNFKAFFQVAENVRLWAHENKDVTKECYITYLYSGSRYVQTTFIYDKLWVKNECDNEMPLFDFAVRTTHKIDEKTRFAFNFGVCKLSCYKLDEKINHPHVGGDFPNSFSEMCRGSNTQMSHYVGQYHDIDDFEIYSSLEILDTYLRNESLSGGPYRPSTKTLKFVRKKPESTKDYSDRIDAILKDENKIKEMEFSFDSEMNVSVKKFPSDCGLSNDFDQEGSLLVEKDTKALIPTKTSKVIDASDVVPYYEKLQFRMIPLSDEDFERMVKSYFKYENAGFRSIIINKIENNVKDTISFTKIFDNRSVIV
jgi:hypothetical protein